MKSITLEQLLNLLSQKGQRLKLTLTEGNIVLSKQDSDLKSPNDDVLLIDYSLETQEDFKNLVSKIEQKQNQIGFNVFLTRSLGLWGEHYIGISIVKIHENQQDSEISNNFDFISKLDVYGSSEAFSLWYQKIF